MHVFLCGPSGVGKSTIIRDVVASLSLAPKGFITYKVREQGKDRVYGQAFCGGGALLLSEDKTASNANFNELRHTLLGILPGDIVIMDELGFLESRAFRFQAAVIDALDKPCTVLGVIKARSGALLDSVRNRGDVRIIDVTAETRSEVMQEVLALMKSATERSIA